MDTKENMTSSEFNIIKKRFTFVLLILYIYIIAKIS